MSAGAAAAGAAAAAARRKMQQEEEEMTTYSPQDLSDGWEFKILRSVRGIFRDPDKLREVLAEEGRAGWILVEKFDDGRIRLKRPTGTREFDGKLDFDPYRTNVGLSENKYALVIVGIVTAIIAAFLGFIALVVNAKDNPRPEMPPAIQTVAPAEKPLPQNAP
jgi:hypothetical protein